VTTCISCDYMNDAPDTDFITAFTEAQSSLREFCMASVGNAEDAKDVFQKTCLVLWRKAEQWDRKVPFFAWAMGVARYEILAHVRDSARERLVFDEDVVQAMTGTAERLMASQTDRSSALGECLAELKTEHRDSLADFYVHGYSMQEISRRQGRGPSAVKVMIMRLRQTLRTCIERKLAEQA
jgi:RNA polymerase sigma-70 factor (ECF subfamily)